MTGQPPESPLRPALDGYLKRRMEKLRADGDETMARVVAEIYAALTVDAVAADFDEAAGPHLAELFASLSGGTTNDKTE